jgi:hypothetical protein
MGLAFETLQGNEIRGAGTMRQDRDRFGNLIGAGA